MSALPSFADLNRAKAVDVGFGFTKVALSPMNGLDMPGIVFPSMAAMSSGDAGDLQGIGFGALQTVNVEADANQYWVGPDVMLRLATEAVRVTSDDFFILPDYLALFRGALSYMTWGNDFTADVLVGGLPLTVWRNPNLREHVRQRMVGQHHVPIANSPGRMETIVVRDVQLVPQSLGALWSMSAARGDDYAARAAQSTNLIIDCGYGTLMWLTTQGSKPIPARSSANMLGVNSLLRAVTHRIDQTLSSSATFLARLDDALRKTLEASQGEFMAELERQDTPLALCLAQATRSTPDMPGFSQAIRYQIKSSLQSLTKSVGDKRTIDTIWLTGGGVRLYKEAIAEAFAGVDIVVDETLSQFTNVRGFQMLAEDVLGGAG